MKTIAPSIRFLRVSIFLLSLVISFETTRAQHPFWDNYLATTDIRAVKKQGSDFWIASFGGGLMKANADYSVLTYYNKHNSGISSVFLTALGIDGAGNKWIGTNDGTTGLMCLSTTNTWTKYNTSNSLLPSNLINSIEVHDGVVWIGTRSGLVKIDGGVWTVYTIAPYAGNPYPLYRVEDIAFDSAGSVWVCCATVGVLKYNGTQWRVYTHANSGLATNEVRSLTVDIDGSVWIGHMMGISVLSDTTWTNYMSILSLPPPTNQLADIYAIRSDTAGNIWAMHTYNGLYKYSGGVWQFFGKTPMPNYYLAKNPDAWPNFLEILIDEDGALWLSGMFGLAKYDTTWHDYTAYIQSELVCQGITCLNNVNPQQSVFIGENIPMCYPNNCAQYQQLNYHGNGLSNFTGSSWSQYDLIDSCHMNNVIYTLYGKNDNLWIGFRNGACRYDGTTYTRYDWSFPCSNNNLTTAFGTNSQGLFAGTSYGNLLKFDGINWTTMTTPLSNLGSRISCISNIQDTLLIGCQHGLLKYDTAVSIFYNTLNSGLPSDAINDMVYDNFFHCYWIATENGLVQTNLTYWIVYNTSNSALPDNKISSLALDDNHNLWLGTKSKGLLMFNGAFYPYNIYNSGLTDSMITDIIVDPQNNIWIGTAQGGLCVFHYGTWLDDHNQTNPVTHNSKLPDLQIYPNPVLNNASLKITLNEPGIISVVLYNAMGSFVRSVFYGKADTGQLLISLKTSSGLSSDLPAGVYFCTLIAENQKITKRLLVLR
ncbi:MAG: two-component regulator propeller domain-containing protein [Bacteroidota bacterium]